MADNHFIARWKLFETLPCLILLKDKWNNESKILAFKEGQLHFEGHAITKRLQF